MPHTGQEKSAIVLQYRKGLPIQELSEKYTSAYAPSTAGANCAANPTRNKNTPSHTTNMKPSCEKSPNWRTLSPS